VFVMLPLTVVLILAVAFMYFFFTTARVEGASMHPTLRDGDLVLVATSYETPVRGDVVVFTPTPGENGDELVKRVVAVPDDVVEVERGSAIVNGFAEVGGYELRTDPEDVSTLPYTVPDGHVFVLGDNRPDSLDSRFFGPVPVDVVVGRVVLVLWPADRFGIVDARLASD